MPWRVLGVCVPNVGGEVATVGVQIRKSAMTKSLPSKEEVLDAIRKCAQEVGHSPSRSEFKAHSRISEYQILEHFPSWSEAVRATGLEPDSTHIRLSDDILLEDWGRLVREKRSIPTRNQYRREGKFSQGVFDKHFGPWSSLPARFKAFASGNAEWTDVLALLPETVSRNPSGQRPGEQLLNVLADTDSETYPQRKYTKLAKRPTYGNPIDFRGLRHEPVNEAGVVFLFGMVARELGYFVEAIQADFPDCEAKRQVDAGKWQRVRIEFEFESRNFRDHGHPPDDCDVLVCWRHNWDECPESIEILELKSIIRSLAQSDD